MAKMVVKPFGKKGGYVYFPKEMIGKELEVITGDIPVITQDSSNSEIQKIKKELLDILDRLDSIENKLEGR